jgi:hypothetical protein
MFLLSTELACERREFSPFGKEQASSAYRQAGSLSYIPGSDAIVIVLVLVIGFNHR